MKSSPNNANTAVENDFNTLCLCVSVVKRFYLAAFTATGGASATRRIHSRPPASNGMRRREFSISRRFAVS